MKLIPNSFPAIFCFILTLCFANAQQPAASASPETKSQNALGFINPMGGERPKGAQTEITANGEATYDNAKNIAEFSGGVVVRDTQFTLTCDNLLVHLGKDQKGLESVDATGNVVIIQEKSDPKSTAAKSIGRAGEVTYKPTTGEVVMRKWPSIQQGINQQVATEESTIMILKNSGQSRTIGGSKTLITDSADQK
jgi:lipopolysaccharide transport protein LptA